MAFEQKTNWWNFNADIFFKTNMPGPDHRNWVSWCKR